jgi:hypothetical protein
MPRKRPSRVRHGRPRPRSAIPARLSRGITAELDRSGRPEVSPERVADALDRWARLCRLPRREQGNPNDDRTAFIGPDARDDLQRALEALSPERARELRSRIRKLDRAFAAKTLPDPFADPRLPWWRRRLTGV